MASYNCSVNVFLLAFTAYAKGYGGSHWCTFKAAKERGGIPRSDDQTDGDNETTARAPNLALVFG